MAAAAALDGGAEDPAALQAVADALEALLPLDAALAELAALQDAVDTLQAAATTDAYVPTALDDLVAVRAVAANVTGIAGQLRGLQVLGWGSWRGCWLQRCGLRRRPSISLPVTAPSHSNQAGQLQRSAAVLGGAAGAGQPHQ